MQSSEARRPDMAMNSEPPVTETSQEEPDPSAERLAYSVDEAARLTGPSRDLLCTSPSCPAHRDPRYPMSPSQPTPES